MFDVTSATSFRRTPLFPPEFRKKIERKPARRVRPGGARAGKVFLMRRNRTTECPRLGTSAKRAASGRTFARRSATACVEFAVVLPILLTFVLGVLEVGRFIQVYEILNAAAREGARQASTGQMTNAQVIAAVTGCVQASGLPTAKLNVTVQDLTNAGTDVSQATILDNLQVTVSCLQHGRMDHDLVLPEQQHADFDDGLLDFGQPAELSEQRDGPHGELMMRRTVSRTSPDD